MLEGLTEKGIISEMSSDVGVDVPFAIGVDIKELTKDDDDPLFVTVEALNPQISRNKRIWSEDIIKDVAKQILSKKPDAYKGHLKEADRDSASPTAQTIWLGATMKNMDGKLRLFIKGYVMPYAKELKQYLRAAKAAGKRVSVSVYGEALQKWNSVKKAYDMLQFNLESIDWARPGSEGVPGTGFLQLASEMSKGDEIMDREDVIKSVTVSEMKSINEGLYKEIRQEGEVDAKNAIVQEMQTKIDEAEAKAKEFSDALPEGVEKTPSVIQEMVSSHNSLLESYLGGQIESKVSSKGVRSIVNRQVVSEMAGQFRTKALVDAMLEKVLSSEEVKCIVQEMKSQVNMNPGEDNRHTVQGSRFIKK